MYRSFTRFLVFALLIFPVVSVCASDAIFDAAQWNYRVLVITGPVDDLGYVEQVEALEESYEGMEERLLIPVHYKDRSVKKIEGLSPFSFRYKRVLKKTSEQRYMQRRLGGSEGAVDDDVFSVILIGLDGEVKRVWRDGVVEVREIFDTIDEMPIRQRQLEEQ